MIKKCLLEDGSVYTYDEKFKTYKKVNLSVINLYYIGLGIDITNYSVYHFYRWINE